MSRFLTLVVAFFAIASTGECFAQSRARGVQNQILNRPTVSPYLNLTRNQGSLAISTNYHSLVRPQLDARRRAQQQDNSLRRVQSQLSNLQNTQVSALRRRQQQQRGFITGHPTARSYYSHYYPGLTNLQR